MHAMAFRKAQGALQPEERVLPDPDGHDVRARTFKDGRDSMKRVSQIDILPRITCYELDHANQALDDLREGRIDGTAVLVMEEP